MIRKYGGPNAIPKLNNKKFVGKLLKGDYIAALINILSESYGNDYCKVTSVLEEERSVVLKKGFGKN